MHDITKVNIRQKLPPKREPYWSAISKGCHLGFRKMGVKSEGTWCARFTDEKTGKKHYRSFGSLDMHPDHRRIDIAKELASQWFTHLGRGGSTTSYTVRDVCNRYVRYIKESKGEKAASDIEKRFSNYVLNQKNIADLDVSKLTPTIIQDWRTYLTHLPTKSGQNRGKARSRSSLNRDMTCFRAALNLSLRDGISISDFAWKEKLRPLPDADKRRDVYLDRAQRKSLVDACKPDLASFIQVQCWLPLRPGALAELTVSNFDPKLKTLNIEKDKVNRNRKIKLPEKLAEYLATQCCNKLPKAPLLSQDNGKSWQKDAWKNHVKASIALAKLPSEATLYSVRHSVITDLIHEGLDTLTVAQLSGTSIRMIEKHYGHLTMSHAQAALERLSA